MATWLALGRMAIIACVVSVNASAATSVQSSRSSGLAISISKVIVSGKRVILQFVITNNTAARVYVLNARNDETQKAFLGSGETLSNPAVVGLAQCSDDLTSCMNPQSHNGNDLSLYSYIEPTEFTSFGFTYDAQSPISEADTISFSVAAVARFSTPNGDPGAAGTMKAIRFNFPYVSMKAQ